MADFVAVIRRAVDGLSDNTPEMRGKVYDKARSAVVRQLENMKPRPSDVMFQRQLDKLDDAIRQVEEEYAEAAPADPAETAAPAPMEVAAPAPVATAAPVPEPREAVTQPLPASEPVTAAAPVATEVAPTTEPVLAPSAASAYMASYESPAVADRSDEQQASVAADWTPQDSATRDADAQEPVREPDAYVEPVTASQDMPAGDRTPSVHVQEEPAHLQAEPVETESAAANDPWRSVEPAALAPVTTEPASAFEEPVQAREAETGWQQQATAAEPFATPDDTGACSAEPSDQPTYAAEPHRDAAQNEMPDDRYHEAQDDRHPEAQAESYPQAPATEEPPRSAIHASNRVMEEPYVDAEELPGYAAPVATSLPHDDPAPSAPAEQAAAPQEDSFWSDIPHHDEAAQPAHNPESQFPAWGVDIDREPERFVAAEPAAQIPPAVDDRDNVQSQGFEPHSDEPPAQMPRAAFDETDVATGFNEFLKKEFATPAVPPPPSRKGAHGEFSWDAPFDDLPDLPGPAAAGPAAVEPESELFAAPERKQASAGENPRAELEELIGYDATKAEAKGRKKGRHRAGSDLPPEVVRAVSKLEGKSFKHQKRKSLGRRLNPLPIALGVAGALVVAGGAFGLYHYRDDVSALMASYMPASDGETVETQAVDETPTAAQPAKAVTPAEDKASAVDAPADAKPTEVASLDSNSMPGKFTQRLLADGTETETDAAKIPVDQSLTEGKTVAGQTDAGEKVASTDPASTTPPKAPATADGLGVAQKMFLYEEQLGGSPVAVAGKVTWGLKNDPASAGGKPEPIVEAHIEVPERKLNAIVTFKRNGDASLPASHMVEIVFDLPEDFPEGNVESVQRIAFKQTEQDRGNSLIAVPAKITDDFHMVALNDDADARKVNTELMKTRSWIDIPLVYKNNRRALLTFEKGSTGAEAFDKALTQWAVLGAQANN